MFLNVGPEYKARLNNPFTPTTITLKEIHDAVPKHLLRRSAVRSTLYILRDITFALFLFKFASSIAPWYNSDFYGYISSAWVKTLLKSSLWITYCGAQSLVFAGIFCLGHDAGHQSLYDSTRINNVVGFILHTPIMVPYYSWRSSHHGHHTGNAHMERDETYVPYTRKDFNLPNKGIATRADYVGALGESPIYQLFRLFIMLYLGWWAYMTRNTMGSSVYPPGTNHFNPKSALFRPDQRNSIVITDIGLCFMAIILIYVTPGLTFKYYIIPYLLMNQWIIMFTYLHHSDPTLPHYRNAEWNFVRGAVATVDRPFLGWAGRFFLHNISHDHTAHHFFSRAPFYNGPQITKVIKSVLSNDYNYDSTSIFYAFYRNFSECQFVEEDEDITFYKNSYGVAARAITKPLERLRTDMYKY